MNQWCIWPIIFTLSTEVAGIFIIHMELFFLLIVKVKRFKGREEYKFEAKANIQITLHIEV